MEWYQIILFLLGSCLGSFLNVVILRSVAAINDNRQKFTVAGRSHCPQCHKILRWWELVPIVSFIFLQRRCARCKKPISLQYPLVEFTVALLVMLLATPLPHMWPALILVVIKVLISALIVVLFVVDLKTMYLPDVFVGLLLLASIGYVIVGYGLPLTKYEVLNTISGAALGAGFMLALWVITRGRGIGLGDVKLMIPLGFLFPRHSCFALACLYGWRPLGTYFATSEKSSA
jgi:leader peptidase (prepilin peptidase) / N-methyltransferase